MPVASGGTERIRLNLAEVNFVMATVLPGAISPSFASITFYVRSPLGDPSLTLDAVAMLIFSGANVVLVKEDSTITVPEASTLQVANEDDLRDARRFTQAFGAFDEIQPEVRIEGVDAILTLGESFRTLMADADADAGTSTTGAHVNCILACALDPGDGGDAGVATCIAACDDQYPVGKAEYDAAIGCAESKCATECQ